jgi:type I restriction enzyme, S subunit
MDEWKETTLGSIVTKDGYGLVDGPFGSNLPSSCYVKHGIPVIRGSNLSLSLERFKSDEFVFVSDETAAQLSRSLCRPLDIVFTKKGTLGQVGIIPEESPYSQYLISSNQMKLTVDSTIAYPLYVYYYAASPKSVEKIIRDSESTGVPKTNVTYLRSFPILLPPLPEQKAIAHILGTLDDKIELNRRMNETLEAMARAIFKDWFVDFGPTRAKQEGRNPYLPEHLWSLFPKAIDGETGLPEGWEEKSLDEVADFLNGLALQKYPPLPDEKPFPVIKIAEMRSGITEKSGMASRQIPEKYIVKDGDFLFSWSGSLVAKFWTEGDGALNQHLFKVTSNDYPTWFFTQWTYHHLGDFQRIAAAKATTMGHIQRGHLTAARVVCPQSELMNPMSHLVAPLVENAIKNRLESRTLAELRDRLLPKLMSGEIRVKDAEQMVEKIL